jgi:uncharacterized membrane protein YfcA
MALLPAFIGLTIGRWTRNQVDEEIFQKIFLFSVLALGGYLVWRSGSALAWF